MPNWERNNIRAIERLNQRGGRMLSLVDLLKAGTMDAELASEMVFIVSHGGSFVTAAGPGGTGKTTLMGALLAFLAPGTEIVTIADHKVLALLDSPNPKHRQCLLAHELGSGPYMGYLWGEAVAGYFACLGPNRSLSTNLHAVRYKEVKGILTGSELAVAPADFARLDLLAFMTREEGKRKVTEAWCCDGKGNHVLAWKWLFDSGGSHPGVSGTAAASANDGRSPLEAFAARQGISAEQMNGEIDRISRFLKAALKDECFLMSDLRSRALKEIF